MKNKETQIFYEARNIAIVRTDRIGDMILTLPMVSALKEFNPSFRISIIARKYVKPVLDCVKILDATYYIEDFELGISDILSKYRFDCIFFPHPVLKEAYIAYRIGVPIRIGSGYRWYSFLYNHCIYEHRKKSYRHEAEHNVNMISDVAGRHFEVKLPHFEVNNDSGIYVNEFLKQEFGKFDINYFIVHPGSGGSAYEWEAENFGKLASLIYEQTGLYPVITGNQNEGEKCLLAKKYCQYAQNFCGQLNLSEFIALIDKAKLLIANSTGALHIAGALNVPLIGLYPNTLHISSVRWAPLTNRAIIISPPISSGEKYCDDMSLISVEFVADSAIELLNSV